MDSAFAAVKRNKLHLLWLIPLWIFGVWQIYAYGFKFYMGDYTNCSSRLTLRDLQSIIEKNSKDIDIVEVQKINQISFDNKSKELKCSATLLLSDGEQDVSYRVFRGERNYIIEYRGGAFRQRD